MILKALKTITLKGSSGNITVHKDDIFRTNSLDVIISGYARKLDKPETMAILGEYTALTNEVFGIDN